MISNLKCTECDKKIGDRRYHLGYTVCLDCSDTEKYSAHQVYPHKTGGYVQPISSTKKNHLTSIDRRSKNSGGRVAKGVYVDNSWDRYLKELENPKPKKVSTYVPPKVNYNFRSYDRMRKPIINYYNKVGYEPVMEHLRNIFKKNVIAMSTMTRLQNDVNNLQLLPSRLRKKITKNN